MRHFLLIVIVISLCGAVSADVIHFKDGTVREGKIVRQTAEQVEVEFVNPGGSMRVVYAAENIRRIEMKKTASEVLLEEYRRRLAEIDPADADAWSALGEWCAGHVMLRKYARVSFEHALGIDPEHRAARKALGFVKFRGAWFTEEEAMGAQGLVSHNGKWISAQAYGEALRAESARDTAELIRGDLVEKFAAREKELLAQISKAQDRGEDTERRLREANNRLSDLIDRIERLERRRPTTIIIRDIYPKRPHWWIELHNRNKLTTSTSRKTTETKTVPAGPMKK